MMRITRTTSMTRSLFLLLLFSSFIPDRASAWISSTTSLSSSPFHAPVVVGRKRSRTNHHRRQQQYFHEKRRRLLRSTIITRSSFLLHQSSRDHDDDDDDDGTIDVEEEEFYHPDFNDDDAKNDNNANNDTDDDEHDNDNDTDLKIKRRTETTTTNKDEELSKAWDDAVINNKEEEGNVSRDLEEGEEEGMISNLSVLQQRLQQQIREQKKKGRPQKTQQQQQPNTKRVQLDDDTLTEFQKWGKDLDDRKQQQQQQQQQKQQMKQNDNIDINEGEGKLQSDVYIDTLQRTQEKLLEITTTANGGMVSSDISDMQKKLTEIQQQQTLKQQQQEAQQEAQHQRDDDDDDDDDGFDIDKGEDEETYKAKNLDDHTLAEWEELENQLKSEQDEERRILLRSRNGNNDDAAMMTASFSEEDNDDNEMNNNNNNDNSYNISPRLDDILPQSEEEELLDEAAILEKISSSTTENKKVVTESEYEVTGDGVFLSAEAYQQACDNANTDGSLNFGKTNTSDGSSSSSNNKNKRFLSPSVLEALKAKPMAPYGEEEEEVSGPKKKKKKKKKVITLEDLSQQVTRSRRLVEDNPEAQEELHRRLMAEEPTFENDESDLFKEVLTNPQKASEFWNQEYIEKQNAESSALEKLLDQRMRQLEEFEEQKKNSRNKNVNNTRKMSADAQKQQQKIIDRDIYFASSKKEKDERNKIIESDRLERSKNIAKFYRDTEDDSDWGGFGTKEERNIIKNENDFKNDNDNDDDNNDDDENLVENVLEENQKTKKDSEWVLVEDPTSEEDPFYWNEVSGEMRWEPPSES